MLDETETGELRKKMREAENFIKDLDSEMLTYVMQIAYSKLEWRERAPN